MNTSLRFRIAAVALLCLAAAPTAFAADSDRDVLRKQIRKYAPYSPVTKPKGFCVCQDGSAQHGRAGVLGQAVTSNQIIVACGIPGFTVDGSQNSGANCSTFQVLAK